MEIDEGDSILCMIDEFKAEDHNTRLHAINSLHLIAEAIGEERTRNELIPYMNELLEDENEEVLLSLASKLSELSKYIGDIVHLPCLLPSLNVLCISEETIVQEKALNSLNNIALQMPLKALEENYIPMIESLAANSWCSARIAACSLFQIILHKVNSNKQDELIDLFIRLGADQMPTVRKAAAMNIGVIFKDLYSEKLVKLLWALINDEADSVRQMALQSIVGVVKDPDSLLEVIKTHAKDKSWRVRYTLVENLDKITESIESLFPVKSEILELLKDPEIEVRCITLSTLSFIVKKLPNNIICEEIIPCFENLCKDISQHVRLSLMKAICEVSSQIDSKTSIQKLLPIINQLIRDENFEVRMSFAENMNFFNSAIGAKKVLTFSIPLMMQMMNDGQWRLRLKVLESLPQVAELLGVQQFTEQISAPMMKWVEDPVYAVREIALDSIMKIGLKFGSDWTKLHIVPLIEMLVITPVFNKRMTALRAVNKLSSLLEYQACSEFLIVLASDKVPNIRLNVAKTIANICTVFFLKTDLIRVLEMMKFDCDTDVRFYSTEALRKINMAKL